jgi:hypothetical protein
MKIDVNSKVGRLAFQKNPQIEDECTLYRTLLLMVFMRAVLHIVIPVIVGLALVTNVAVAIHHGAWPHPNMFNKEVTDVLTGSFWTPFAVVVTLTAALLSGILLIVPFLVAAGVVCAGVALAWNHGLSGAVSRVTQKTREVTGLDVVAQGIRNWKDGICRKIEVFDSRLPEGLEPGARILVDKTEYVVNRYDTRLDALDDEANVWLFVTAVTLGDSGTPVVSKEHRSILRVAPANITVLSRQSK